MISYILNSFLCSAILLLVYKLLLEKEKLHQFNRYYLLVAAAMALVIPAITIQLPNWYSSNAALTTSWQNVSYEAAVASSIPKVDRPKSLASDFSYYPWIYLTVAGLLLARFIFNLGKISRTVINNKQVDYQMAKLVLLNSPCTPHSFWKWIFVYKKEYENDAIHRSILVHEHTHVVQKHSIDMLVIELIHCIFWFNPIFIFYKKAMQLNHEFLADSVACRQHNSLQDYQKLILEHCIPTKLPLLSSAFNYSTLKTRMTMMTKVSSKTVKMACMLAVIPAMLAIVIIFSKKTLAQSQENISSIKSNVKAQIAAHKREVPYSLEGISAAELENYRHLLKQNTKIIQTKKGIQIIKTDEAIIPQLEGIFLRMSKEQQAAQDFIFVPAPALLPKISPTKAEFEAFKNAKIYGVWLDGRKIQNNELNKIQYTDIASYWVSNLYANARRNVSYVKQVDLSTERYYKQYLQILAADQKKYFMANGSKPRTYFLEKYATKTEER